MEITKTLFWLVVAALAVIAGCGGIAASWLGRASVDEVKPVEGGLTRFSILCFHAEPSDSVSEDFGFDDVEDLEEEVVSRLTDMFLFNSVRRGKCHQRNGSIVQVSAVIYAEEPTSSIIWRDKAARSFKRAGVKSPWRDSGLKARMATELVILAVASGDTLGRYTLYAESNTSSISGNSGSAISKVPKAIVHIVSNAAN